MYIQKKRNYMYIQKNRKHVHTKEEKIVEKLHSVYSKEEN